MTPLLTAASRSGKPAMTATQQRARREGLAARNSRLTALVYGLAASAHATVQPVAEGRAANTPGRAALSGVSTAAASAAGSVNGSAAIGESSPGTGPQGDGRMMTRGEIVPGMERTRKDGIGRYSWRYVGICSDKTWVAALLVDGTRGNQQGLVQQYGGYSCWVEEEWGDVPKGYAIPV